MSGNEGTSRWHVDLCPRKGLSCECDRCHPPQCLCRVIETARRDDAEAFRIAFYAAATEATA